VKLFVELYAFRLALVSVCCDSERATTVVYSCGRAALCWKRKRELMRLKRKSDVAVCAVFHDSIHTLLISVRLSTCEHRLISISVAPVFDKPTQHSICQPG